MGIVALFEKIYDDEPILTAFSVSDEDLQYHCSSKVYYVKTVPQSDIDSVFENDK